MMGMAGGSVLKEGGMDGEGALNILGRTSSICLYLSIPIYIFKYLCLTPGVDKGGHRLLW